MDELAEPVDDDHPGQAAPLLNVPESEHLGKLETGRVGPERETCVILKSKTIFRSLQISAFYFPSFEKADCTIFVLSVGWRHH